jgi:Glutathionylspermidine synthase preATP-grasp
MVDAARIAVVRACPGDPLEARALTRELAERYFVFDACVGGGRRVDVHPLVLSPAMHADAVRAAEDVARTVGAVAAVAHEDEGERAAYGLHADTLRLARASWRSGDHACLARVDLLLDEQGTFRACEINADCPGGHNEALGLPRLARVAGFTGGVNPTTVVDAAAHRLQQLACGGAVGLVYATAYAEDLQVCALLARKLMALGTEALLAPPTAPRTRGRELSFGPRPLRALYRFFPTEWMAGQRNIGDIAAAVESGRVRTLSSFAHIFAQSKVAFARAWTHEPTLAPADRDVLAARVPFTADAADIPMAELVGDRAGWVLKRAMGRVGDQVFVGALFPQAEWSTLVRDVLAARATGERWLAQRYVRQATLPTPWGPRYVTLGAYVMDGRFVGYFARITKETHVSHDALCVPVFVASSEEGVPCAAR